MSIALQDLRLYGCATMADDESTTQIGGAVDKQKKLTFTDVNGSVQIVAENGADNSQTIHTYGRDSAGNIVDETKTLDGQTPVAVSQSFERLLKAIKNVTCAGPVAVEAAVAERAGTCQSGTTLSAVLDAGASAVDNAYRGMIFRITSGTGGGQIREVLSSDGTTKAIVPSSAFSPAPDGTSVFRLSKGFFFDKLPSEIYQVRRLFYNAGANPPGGATKKFYDKGFYFNEHGSLDLTTAIVHEEEDPAAVVAFGLEAALDGTTDNGGGNNRQVAPAGITFDSADKNVANSQSLTHAKGQPTWFELTLAGGAAAQKTSYSIKLQGNTV